MTDIFSIGYFVKSLLSGREYQLESHPKVCFHPSLGLGAVASFTPFLLACTKWVKGSDFCFWEGALLVFSDSVLFDSVFTIWGDFPLVDDPLVDDPLVDNRPMVEVLGIESNGVSNISVTHTKAPFLFWYCRKA